MPYKLLAVCSRACREATHGRAANDAPFRNRVLGTASAGLPGRWWRITFARTPCRGACNAKRLRLVALDAPGPKACGEKTQAVQAWEANLQTEHPVRTLNLGCILSDRTSHNSMIGPHVLIFARCSTAPYGATGGQCKMHNRGGSWTCFISHLFEGTCVEACSARFDGVEEPSFVGHLTGHPAEQWPEVE
jgi:hypothetical protein